MLLKKQQWTKLLLDTHINQSSLSCNGIQFVLSTKLNLCQRAVRLRFQIRTDPCITSKQGSHFSRREELHCSCHLEGAAHQVCQVEALSRLICWWHPLGFIQLTLSSQEVQKTSMRTIFYDHPKVTLTAWRKNRSWDLTLVD